MPILASTARYAGDEMLAVAAVDEETAESALELITVDYEILPFVLDAEEAMKPSGPKALSRGERDPGDRGYGHPGRRRGGIQTGRRDPRREVPDPPDPAYDHGTQGHCGELERRRDSRSGTPTKIPSACGPTLRGRWESKSTR